MKPFQRHPRKSLAVPTVSIEGTYRYTLMLNFNADCEFSPGEVVRQGQDPIGWFTFRDTPEPGFVTACTYGLSLTHRPDWVDFRPELIMSTKAESVGMAVAHLAELFRHDSSFRRGEVLRLPEPIIDGCAMQDFVIAAPTAIQGESTILDIGDCYRIGMVGIYPVHPTEAAYIEEHGFDQFSRTPGEWSLLDLDRLPIR